MDNMDFNIDEEFMKDWNEILRDVDENVQNDTNGVTYDDLLCSYIASDILLKKVTHDLELLKLTLKVKKLELKYSDEYSKFKTIKEKEERAELETSMNKLKIEELTSQVEYIKTMKKYYKLLMENMSDESTE